MACGPGHTWHHLLTGSRTSRVQSRNVNSSVSDYKAWALNWSRACSSATPPCHHAPLPSNHYSQAHLVSTQLLSIHFPQLQAGATRRHRQPQFQRAPHQSALQADSILILCPETNNWVPLLGLWAEFQALIRCGWSQFFQEQVLQLLVIHGISTAWRLLEMQNFMPHPSPTESESVH